MLKFLPIFVHTLGFLRRRLVRNTAEVAAGPQRGVEELAAHGYLTESRLLERLAVALAATVGLELFGCAIEGADRAVENRLIPFALQPAIKARCAISRCGRPSAA